MSSALERLHHSARDQTMMGMKGITRGNASRQPTGTGRRRQAHQARAILRTSDTPPARVGLGKERPQARCGDRARGGGLDGLDARATETARWAPGWLMRQSRRPRPVAVVAGLSGTGRPASAWRQPPSASQLGRARTAQNRPEASHVFASLKRLGQGFAPTPRGGLRCAQTADKPRARVGVA